MAQIILDSNNNLIQGDFDNATVNNRTKFKTTTTDATTNVYAVPNGSATSAGFSVSNAADPTNASKITIATNGSTDTQIISGVNGSGTYLPLSFYTNNTLAMQVTTGGNVLIAGATNTSASRLSLIPQSAEAISIPIASGQTLANIRFQNTSNSTIGYIQWSGSATTYNTTSDYRLKENITPMVGALNLVQQLKPVTYTWKIDGSAGQGFIAHELAEVCPQAVSGEKDAVNEDGSINPQGVDTSFLVATLTAAIQEQQTIINELKSRIEALESK